MYVGRIAKSSEQSSIIKAENKNVSEGERKSEESYALGCTYILPSSSLCIVFNTSPTF